MSPTSEGWPTEPAYLGVSIQPATPFGDEPVPAEWLERPDLIAQAERLDRLAADFDLVTTLSLAGFEGGDWDYFEQELAKYGIAVMGGWLRTGLIFSRYAARGFGGLPEMSRDFEPDEIEELTYETVSKALFHFRRDVLMKHAWDYRKGATLRTFLSVSASAGSPTSTGAGGATKPVITTSWRTTRTWFGWVLAAMGLISERLTAFWPGTFWRELRTRESELQCA
jgi:hypothetical protein